MYRLAIISLIFRGQKFFSLEKILATVNCNLEGLFSFEIGVLDQ